LPAFRIFNDQTLRAIAQRRPANSAELLAVPGIGISAVEKYWRGVPDWRKWYGQANHNGWILLRLERSRLSIGIHRNHPPEGGRVKFFV
jgi:hypothetical protein